MNYTGFLNVYKEKGMTSMAVCARIRRILHVTKAGHAGTLDPMAEGVLPVALGRACKSIDEAGDRTKVYRAGMLLGTVTDTQDITGNVISVKDVSVDKNEIEAAINSFLGEYDQLTPMYSARQIDGRRLYDIARSGETVERPVKKIEIFDLKIESINIPHVVFTVKCTKGTYIRTLCNDIGEKLGCGACMEKLERLSVGDFLIEDSLHFEDIEKLEADGRIDETLKIITPTAVSIGKFDGTHEGHKALLSELRKSAQKKGLRSLVLILDVPGKCIEEKEARKEYILSTGIDYCLEYTLGDELKNMNAGDFLKNVLCGRLNMKYLVAGKDVCFGKGREGNADFLKTHASEYGYSFRLIDKIKLDETVISSTLLREEIASGNMENAGRLMGRPFTVSGTADDKGRIKINDGLLMPPYGVYETSTMIILKEDKQTRNDLTAPKNRNAVIIKGTSELYEEEGNIYLKPCTTEETDISFKSVRIMFGSGCGR